MIKHKEDSLVSDNEKQQAVAPRTLKRPNHRKRWVIVTIITLIFIIGVIVAWLFMANRASSPEQVAKRAKEITQTVNDAQKLANNGNIDGAKTAFDNAINKTDDPYTKSTLLISKATIPFNTGKYDDALVIAKEAEVVNQNDAVDSFIAQVYEKKDDKQNAIKYYQKAIGLIDKSQPMANSDAKYYQSRIDALNGIK